MTHHKPPHVELYEGRKRFRQAWRWRVVAENGDTLADSAEAYTNKADAEKIIAELFPELAVFTK